MPRGTCDQGLTCVRQPNMIIGAGKCVKDSPKQGKIVMLFVFDFNITDVSKMHKNRIYYFSVKPVNNG